MFRWLAARLRPHMEGQRAALDIAELQREVILLKGHAAKQNDFSSCLTSQSNKITELSNAVRQLKSGELH